MTISEVRKINRTERAKVISGVALSTILNTVGAVLSPASSKNTAADALLYRKPNEQFSG